MTKMIAPERCFQLYLSIKTHFANEKYDAIKHNGRIKNATIDDFNKRNDKALITLAAKRFYDTKHAASFFVANFAYGNTYPFDDEEKATKLYTQWQRNRQSLTKMFMDDLDYLTLKGVSYEKLVSIEQIPPLFVAYKSGKINIETLTIMNALENFSDSWKSIFHLWRDDLLRIRKLESFIKFDEAKFQQIYSDFKESLVAHHEEV
jgi:hypothetical protein